MTTPYEVDETATARGIGKLLASLLGKGGEDPFNSALTEGTGTTPTGQTTTPSTATPGTEQAVSPVSGPLNVSQAYGVNGHPGVDIAVPVGTPVLSAMNGTVTHAANDDPGGYGQWVEVTAPDGTVTRYGHLSNLDVQQGTQVRAGQLLGASGGEAGASTSGNSTGAHLHFEVHSPQGNSYDPMQLLAGGAQIIGQPGTGQAGALVTTGTTPKTPEGATATGIQRLTEGLSGGTSEEPSQTATPTTGTAGAQAGPEGIDAFLNATKQHESGGNYRIYNTSGLSDASGAYQFISTTWNNYGGYRNAADAPPEIQDQKAREMASQLYDRYHDWRLVAIAWYGGPAVADRVARGEDPGSPQGQGPYLAYGDTIMRMMGGGNG